MANNFQTEKKVMTVAMLAEVIAFAALKRLPSSLLGLDGGILSGKFKLGHRLTSREIANFPVFCYLR